MSGSGSNHLIAGFLLIGVVLGGALMLYPTVMTDGESAVERADRSGSDEVMSVNGSAEDTGEYEGDAVYGLSGDSQDSDNISGLNHTFSLELEHKPWFEDVTEEKNLFGDFTLEELENPHIREGRYGSGVFVSDYNNNGREDVLGLVNFHPVLFENTGDGFVETDHVDADEEVTSVLFFDHDNDGYDDIYLLSNEGSKFLENEGGEFVEKDVGLEVEYDSVRGATAADYTGNGCLDIFVIQAGVWTEERPAGFDEFVPIEEDNGNLNRLFAGDCGTFEETTEEAGIEGEAWSLATSFVDFSGDGYPDIHVANDFNNDVVYFNNGDGTFERDVLPDYTNRNGMSSEVADVTGNGHLDIFVSNIYHGGLLAEEGEFGGRVEGNNLLKNHGNSTFTDVADEYGVRRGGWGWAALFEDFSNDGVLEGYQTTIAETDLSNIFWVKNEDRYELMTSESFGKNRTNSIGTAALDYNGNGRLDMVEAHITKMNRFYLLENGYGDGDYLRVSLEGDTNQTDIGTTVEVTADDRTWMEVKKSDTDYFSQSSRVLHFGFGNVSHVDEVEVTWPDGEVEVVEDVNPNQEIEIVRGEDGDSR